MKSINQEADEIVNGDRQASYGHPIHDFSRTARLWNVILGVHVTPQQVALCMIAVKLSREINKHKRDNLVDICGYAQTNQLVEDELKKRHYPGISKAVGEHSEPNP